MNMNGAVVVCARHTIDLACFAGSDRHVELPDSYNSRLLDSLTPHTRTSGAGFAVNLRRNASFTSASASWICVELSQPDVYMYDRDVHDRGSRLHLYLWPPWIKPPKAARKRRGRSCSTITTIVNDFLFSSSSFLFCPPLLSSPLISLLAYTLLSILGYYY